MDRVKPLFRVGVLLSAIGLAAGFVAYRAGAFSQPPPPSSTADEHAAPAAAPTPTPATAPDTIFVPAQGTPGSPPPIFLAGSKSMPIVIAGQHPPGPGSTLTPSISPPAPVPAPKKP